MEEEEEEEEEEEDFLQSDLLTRDRILTSLRFLLSMQRCQSRVVPTGQKGLRRGVEAEVRAKPQDHVAANAKQNYTQFWRY